MNHNHQSLVQQSAGDDIRVVFLHGSGSDGSSRKAGVLRGVFRVEAPDLPFPDKSLSEWVKWAFVHPEKREAARRLAQSLVDSFQPHVICGSSMGGALAATLESDAAMVLVAPACGLPTSYAIPNVLPARTVILHSPHDSVVPQANSRRLLKAHPGRTADEQADVERIRAGLAALGYDQSCPRLVSIGRNHACNEADPADTRNEKPQPHAALVAAIRLLAARTAVEPSPHLGGRGEH